MSDQLKNAWYAHADGGRQACTCSRCGSTNSRRLTESPLDNLFGDDSSTHHQDDDNAGGSFLDNLFGDDSDNNSDNNPVDMLTAEIGGATGLALVAWCICGIIVACWPCLVFKCVNDDYIKPRAQRGQNPSCCAWVVCMIFFFLTVFTALGVGFTWFILPFCMVIPFCMGKFGALNLLTVVLSPFLPFLVWCYGFVSDGCYEGGGERLIYSRA